MPNPVAAALTLTWIAAAAPAFAAAPDLVAGLESLAAPTPLVRQGRLERHTPETLWERIDGEAELYMSFGLAGSAHLMFADPGQDERRVELSVFSFQDPLGAFGVFASFRSSSCVVHSLGNDGCLGDYQGYFWHGDVFVVADAAGPRQTRPGDLQRMLEAAAVLLGPPPPPPKPLRDFSLLAEPGTIRYQPRHLLGREALPPGLEGTVRGTAVFVSVGPRDPAGAALESYAVALEGAVRGERDGYRTLAGQDRFLGPLTIVGSGQGIVGARAAADTPGLWELLDALGASGKDPGRKR